MNVSHYDSIILESNASAVAVLSTLNIACALITFTNYITFVRMMFVVTHMVL